jgi:hypothetical protein
VEPNAQEIAAETNLVGPQSSVNLMEKSEEKSSSFAVDVHDEDQNHVPSDIIAEETTSFWKRPDVKMWMYILAGSILIFTIVFAVLSRETSLFRGFAITEPSDVQEQDENVFDGFNNRAANETSDDDDGTIPEESTVDEDIVDNAPVVGFEVETPEEDTETDPVETDIEEDILDDDFEFIPDDGFDDFEIVFDDGLDFSPGDIPGVIPAIDFSDSLGSNTNANIMASSEVQGDTGPAIWLAMVPSMLYAFGRKKK